jgi:hypothetical protein
VIALIGALAYGLWEVTGKVYEWLFQNPPSTRHHIYVLIFVWVGSAAVVAISSAIRSRKETKSQQTKKESVLDGWSYVQIAAREQIKTDLDSAQKIDVRFWEQSMQGRLPRLAFRQRSGFHFGNRGQPTIQLSLILGLPMQLGPAKELRGEIVFHAGRPYAVESKLAPPQITKRLKELCASARPKNFPMLIPTSLAGVPWEALLDPEFPGGGHRVLCWRQSDVLPRPDAPQLESVVSICVQKWRAMAEGGWKAGWSQAPVVASDLPASEGKETVRILHIVGTPALTGGQWRMALRPSLTSRIIANEDYFTQTDEVPFANYPVIIVQGEPVQQLEAYGGRSSTEREQAAALKCYGASVMAGGAEAVVVIPSLPESLCIDILAGLCAGIQIALDPHERRIRLLGAIADMRKLICSRNALVASRQTLDELSKDLCLFARRRADEPWPTTWELRLQA